MTAALELRGRRVINARGHSTKVGGCVLSPAVVEAMAEAAGFFVRIEDMQAAAGEEIARATGAEAGYVTAGASAGLSLAAAAAIAGLDPVRMNRLPDTNGMPNEIVCLRQHRNDYDHALRLAGGKIVEVGFNDWTFGYEIAEAIGPNTAAVFYLARDPGMPISLAEVVEIAHARDLPVIVDASMALPPARNLRDLIGVGADLVAFSGGKHIKGPQASGILAGRRDLITSVALQHQDMDVYPPMWPARRLIEDGLIVGPPHHGIGRGFKVGKEEIAGLVTALREYLVRDVEAEYADWTEHLETFLAALGEPAGIRARRLDPVPTARPVPWVSVQVSPDETGTSAIEIVNALQSRDPIICVAEANAVHGEIVINPESLLAGDAEEVAAAIRSIVRSGSAQRAVLTAR